MPDLNGLEFSKLLPQKSKVIFTTAFDQYAIAGYKVNAVDYLLKPFDYTEFLNAATKVRNYFVNQQTVSEKLEKKHEFFFVKSKYKQIKINFPKYSLLKG
ncbi:response regulator [Chryseobacterium sp. CFS15]|uniref:LytR/AlgR family response regulator transcription factor n=1 Tax=Chryseobacterium sp. CFS15 TaxID=2986946 RepID=UPI0028098E40|nr:response regulator [Chryseobacterium sp. CFS15]MDQ8141450.1 response regulator [Chryseobacterium sp. CFS15]